MKRLLTILLPGILVLAWLAGTAAGQKAPEKAAVKPASKAADGGQPRPNLCLDCHGNADVWEGDQLRLYVIEKNLAGDIHWQKGLRCADCHGGNPATDKVNEAHAEEDGFRSLRSAPKDYAKPPEPAKVVELCGNCHANIEFMRRYHPSPRVDQLREYWTSGHGRRLKEAGDVAVATCVSCHGQPHGSGEDKDAHGIRAVADLESPVYRTHVAQTCAKCHADAKLMAGRQYRGRALGHSQYEDWRQSVHAEALLKKGDLSAATCNNCHGNHGALPPNVDSVAYACGSCHIKQGKLFSEAQMKHGFEKAGLPGCATCHNEHLIRMPADRMLGMQEGAVCARCHEKGRYGAPLAGRKVAEQMRKGMDDLRQGIADAQAEIAEAERLGMEVRGPRFDLRKANDALTNARVLIHGFAVKPVQDSLDEGLKTTSEVRQSAEAAMREYDARRAWLAGSLVPILVVIVLLLLYIRTLPVRT